MPTLIQEDTRDVPGARNRENLEALVLEAFDTLFNQRDYATAAEFWSPDYVQHSAHIAPGRDGLFNLVRSAPDTLRYENQLIVANGDEGGAPAAAERSASMGRRRHRPHGGWPASRALGRHPE